MSSIRVNAYKWIESEVPTDLEVRQVYGFVFSPDGRILLFEDEGQFNLPGGKPDNGESFSETLIREAEEEVQVTIASIEYLGYQLIAADEDFAQVRMVALIDQIRHSVADPSTGRHYARLWVPPTQSNGLLKWGASGDEQVASAIAVVSKLGISWDGNPLTRIEIN